LERQLDQETSSKLKNVTEAARPHLSNGEFREIEELLAEEDTFAVDNEDHGRTKKVYQRIDTGDARPFRQPPRRLHLAKHAEVSEMLDDMQRRWAIEESYTPVVLVKM
jgi:predicted ArsR family transcriptional regulator